ncbi:hypothetical protein ZWY2020_052703 [Hordeum vulgare]|nr:hypothetical protein ZWY2020_052703 [Hordeum vulgare]
MDDVCDECGDVGYSHLLLRCSNCNNAARHRYCLDEINFDLAVEWLCSDCIPKHSEAIKSPGETNCQRQLRNTQLSFFVVNEPNILVNMSSGDTSNRGRCVEETLDSCEIFVSDIPNHIDCKKEGEDINGHLICAPESYGGSSNFALDHASSIEPNNLQKAIGGSKLASGYVDCHDLPNARSGCFASSKYVEGFFPRGRKGDMFSLMNDVEGSCPMIVDKSCSTSACMEQADGLSVNMEKSEPSKLVKGLEESVVAAKFAPNHSKPMQGSDLKKGSVDVLNPLEQRLDSLAMLQSSSLNELNDAAIQENGAERTRCFAGKETVASELGNHKGSNPSMANESLSSSQDFFSCRQKVPLQLILQEKGINNELLPSKFLSPCESTKINPRKRKQSEDYAPDGTKYQEDCIISGIGNANVALAKSGRPLRACQYMPRKDNGSNDKVIGHSKMGKSKKMGKSWLANNGIRDSRKRGMVTGVLQPNSLRRRSVDRSRPSENMDPALMESSCALNNPSSSCAAQSSEEDAEALQAEDLNSRSCDDDEHVKKQRKCMENAAENQRRSVKEGKEALGSGNLNHQYSKNRKQVKKQRGIEAEEDENASVRNPNTECARMPVISECIGGQPLDIPYWTGIMKVNNNYIPLAAHLSTKAGKKVQELSRSLPPIMKVAKLSTSKSCPKHLEAPIPTADSIGLYFFSGDMRPNKELDELVKHLADSGIILEAVVGLAKLFVFPSAVLPAEYQTFQGKPYLWGVFKPRKYKIRRLPPVEQDCMAHVSKEEHAQEQHALDQEDKAQTDTLDHVVHYENQPLLDANQQGKEASSGNGLTPVDVQALVCANIGPADHRQPCSNPEAPPLELCGFVVSRTPRSAQLIQEMQKEGALLFAVQQVITEPGSVM